MIPSVAVGPKEGWIPTWALLVARLKGMLKCLHIHVSTYSHMILTIDSTRLTNDINFHN